MNINRLINLKKELRKFTKQINHQSSFRRMLGEIWYRFTRVFYRLHTRLTHHRLDLRNYEYSGGWCDRDMLVLYASFNLLKDFIELERPYDWFETKESAHKESWLELKALYDWWSVTRPERNPDGDPLGEYYLEDTEKLIQLMKIRYLMWT